MCYKHWLGWGAAFLCLALTNQVLVALTLAVLAGFFESVIDVPMVSLIQAEIPDDKRGKVFGFWSTAGNLGDALSAVIFGLSIGNFGAPDNFLASGTLIILAAAVFLTRSFVRKKES